MQPNLAGILAVTGSAVPHDRRDRQFFSAIKTVRRRGSENRPVLTSLSNQFALIITKGRIVGKAIGFARLVPIELKMRRADNHLMESVSASTLFG
jgi:hypothetical protein